ncbi:MAG TPA: helix-hairpin-helix domain-containing protein [Nitrospiria bacterium]|nr:helix-hairpin-helix domain-containing protein [Nitrospiria bacterium]
MTNQQVADAFRIIADRLQLEGANPYRIRAYRKAADNLERLKDSVADLAQRGRLKSIPGIGRDLERKILEGLKTGTIREFEPALPGAENAPFDLPGLDPDAAAVLYKRFRIENLQDLEQLARSRLLRTLPNWGPELEHRILAGLESLKKNEREPPSPGSAPG